MPDGLTAGRDSLRTGLVQIALAVVILTAIGALAGVVWQWVWTPPSGLVYDHVWSPDSEAALRGVFTGTGWYAVIASIAGLVGGLLVGLLLDKVPIATLVGVLLGSALAAWVMYVVGVALGPADPAVLARTAADGTRLPGALSVSGASAFLAFGSCALIGLMIVFLGLSAARRGAPDDAADLAAQGESTP